MNAPDTPISPIRAAHRHSSRHRDELLASEICGCFYCCKIFAPSAIKDWLREADGSETARCPFCTIDSVIGSASGFPITPEFLKAMNREWF